MVTSLQVFHSNALSWGDKMTFRLLAITLFFQLIWMKFRTKIAE